MNIACFTTVGNGFRSSCKIAGILHAVDMNKMMYAYGELQKPSTYA